MNAQNLSQQLKNIWEDVKLGAQKADYVQGGPRGYKPGAGGTNIPLMGAAAGASAAQAINKSYKPGAQTTGLGLGYGQSILDPRFKEGLKQQGVTLRDTPTQFLGAYTSRLLVDLANDGTRTYFWRYNHPHALGQAGIELGINKNVIKSPTLRGTTALAIGLPAIAAGGLYDITNPEEQFRSKGYAQEYAPTGADDRRTSAQPTQELFERFFLGRQGTPLKYETAKEDIPSLTPERYKDYMQFRYQDKGLLGLGLVKGTTENLQGVPEARVLGFPVNAPMVGGFAAGTVAANRAAVALKSASPTRRIIGTLAAAAGGSLTGITAGHAINSLIASANNNPERLLSTNEYR